MHIRSFALPSHCVHLVFAATGLLLFPPDRIEPVLAQSAPKSDSVALANFRLTMPTVRKLTLAMENMSAAIKSDPGIAKEAEANKTSANASLDDMAASIDRVPPMKRAIEKAGLTPREYMLAQLALFQAGMIASVMEQQKTKEIPAGFSKANVEFVLANKKEIDQLGARMQQLSKEHSDDESQPESGDAAAEEDTAQ